jgi:hypothetical protein
LSLLLLPLLHWRVSLPQPRVLLLRLLLLLFVHLLQRVLLLLRLANHPAHALQLVPCLLSVGW